MWKPSVWMWFAVELCTDLNVSELRWESLTIRMASKKKNDLICRLETERVHWMDYLNSNYRKFQTHYSSEFIHIKRRPRPTAKFSKFNFLIIKFCCFSFQIIFVCAKQDETITQSHDFTFLNVRVCACVVYLL